MNNIPENSTENLTAKKPSRFGKKLERIVVWLVAWMLSFTFPIWIYGMLLAIGKGEFRSIAAMFVLIIVSGFCLWIKVVNPLIRRMQSGKAQTGEN